MIEYINAFLGMQDVSLADNIQIWIALFSFITALSSLGLVTFGIYQVKELRYSEIKWHTIAACDRYDVDPVLSEATKDIYKRSNYGTNYS